MTVSYTHLLDVAGVFFTQSTYFYQVYDDNRWWTSWYQTLGKGGTTSVSYTHLDVYKRQRLYLMMNRNWMRQSEIYHV